ncbi:MAG: hypothetical protein QXF12_04600 [Candidatus Aenigmatarchaeota archaeon]
MIFLSIINLLFLYSQMIYDLKCLPFNYYEMDEDTKTRVHYYQNSVVDYIYVPPNETLMIKGNVLVKSFVLVNGFLIIDKGANLIIDFQSNENTNALILDYGTVINQGNIISSALYARNGSSLLYVYGGHKTNIVLIENFSTFSLYGSYIEAKEMILNKSILCLGQKSKVVSCNMYFYNNIVGIVIIDEDYVYLDIKNKIDIQSGILVANGNLRVKICKNFNINLHEYKFSYLCDIEYTHVCECIH